jgi:tetratricopeptide (TPR) repeat protein
VNPPLDDRTWIVVPFDNLRQNQEIDWLRAASVNLLYLDMSRWRDIRVIDDERVADYMREVPGAGSRTGPLGLQTGMAVARRAGAGKLVMGDLLKVGSRTAVVAKVFDVRTGQRLRSIREETNNPDSIMAVFGRLARGILNAAPPPGVAVGTIGTTSLGAYQDYVAGVQALNAFDLATARQRFQRALGQDSGFALAHYKLSVVYGWENPNARERLRHAEAANRFAGGLPPRERALIGGQVAQANNRWSDACEAYHALVARDSLDVEGWYNIGECEYHDNTLEAVGGDTTRLAFRGDWNAALHAFRRTLELDPSYHLAFAHIPDVLHADQRAGCLPTRDTCPFVFVAIVIRHGDSLSLTPIRGGDVAALAEQYSEAGRTSTKRANFAQARDLAAAWVQAGPTEPRARMALGRALLRTGDLLGADRQLRLAASGRRSPLEQVQLGMDRVEVAMKLDSFALAVAIFDSLQLSVDSLALGPQTITVPVLGVSFGHFAAADRALQPLVPASSRGLLAVVMRMLAGSPPDSTERVIGAFAAAPPPSSGIRPADVYATPAMWGVRWMRGWTTVPPLDTANRDPRVRLAAALLRGDSGLARRALADLDSFFLPTPPEMPENGFLLAAAEGYLALGDSATALARLLEFERRWPYVSALERLTGGFAFASFLWPRSFLLLGDLAAARGQRDVAVRAYRRAIGMWTGGDPEVQAEVSRARQALARLGAT